MRVKSYAPLMEDETVVLSAILALAFVVAAGLMVAAYLLFLRKSNTTGPIKGNPHAAVVCVGGPSRGKQAHFKNGVLSIGRAPENSIILAESLVSMRHAEVRYRDGRYMLEDLDSGNGVWVSGRRVHQEPIGGGGMFMIGANTFQLVMPGQKVGAAPPQPPTADGAPRRASGFTDVGNYKLGMLIAEGGQANVYRAQSRIDNTQVVIKFMNQLDLGPQGDYMRHKFEQQLLIGSSIRHPHCVRILGGNAHHDPAYMIEEYLPAGTLADRSRGGRMSNDDVVRIIGQACDALQYLHNRRIIHRDLSPNNLMFGTDGGLRVIDFGIAHIAGAATRTSAGMIVGKAKYMSVEQALGTPVLPQSDLYSLACIAYELLVGRPPFEGEPMDVLSMHLQSIPRPVNELVPGVPDHINRAIQRALEKDPAARFASAEEMARAFGYQAAFNKGEISRTGPANINPSAMELGESALNLTVVNNGRTLKIDQSPAVLTRDMVNPTDASMSRQHAQLAFRENLWWLSEVPAKRCANGIYHNGVRVNEDQGLFLSPGDEIRLGETLIKVEGS